MKTTLKAGAELDVLTMNELRTVVEELVSGYLRPPAEARPDSGLQLAGGVTAGIFDLYVVDAGMQFRLTRLFVTVNNATFGVPVAASGGIDVYRGSGSINDALDGTPFTSLPQIATWSRSNGPLFRDGEIVRVGITGAPAGAQVFARAKGYLEPLFFDTESDSV